jgi:hypothetical protein
MGLLDAGVVMAKKVTIQLQGVTLSPTVANVSADVLLARCAGLNGRMGQRAAPPYGWG